MAEIATAKPKKNYAKSSAKEITFSDGSSIINVDLKINGTIAGSQRDIQPNEAGYAKLTLRKLDQPDQYGNTHQVVENTYSSTKASPAAVAAKTKLTPMPEDEFPFK